MTNATQEPGLDAAGLRVDALAQEIRRVDGNHTLGAGALAEALMPFISAYEAHRSGAGEPVAWRWREPIGGNWCVEAHAYKVPNYIIAEPLYASPAKAGELEELRRLYAQEGHKALVLQEALSVSEARARRMEEALRLAEDVLSRAPYSNHMWPNGVHPQIGMEQIRAALSDSPASAARPAVTGAGAYIYTKDDMDRALATKDREIEQIRAALEAALSQSAPASMNGTQGEALSLEQQFLPLAGYDKNQSGYHRRVGWNDAIRHVMDLHRVAAAPLPAQGESR